MKICDVVGCEKPHRARGLCSTHYNRRHQPGRHRALPTVCVVCSTGVERPRRKDRKPTCSVSCRTRLEFGGVSSSGKYSWAEDAVTRARRRGARIVDVFDRETVFDRDGWICGICGNAVDRETDQFDPESATVDHIVPLAEGGEHSLANAQCAHLRCNSAKQSRVTVAGGAHG